jgi:hypothetical protein
MSVNATVQSNSNQRRPQVSTTDHTTFEVENTALVPVDQPRPVSSRRCRKKTSTVPSPKAACADPALAARVIPGLVEKGSMSRRGRGSCASDAAAFAACAGLGRYEGVAASITFAANLGAQAPRGFTSWTLNVRGGDFEGSELRLSRPERRRQDHHVADAEDAAANRRRVVVTGDDDHTGKEETLRGNSEPQPVRPKRS